MYNAKLAQKEYESTRSESRQGIAISSKELKRIDTLITPLIKQGVSDGTNTVMNISLLFDIL